jgi:hypothetical protein
MRRLAAAIVVATTLFAARADAHHSYAAYAEDQTVTMEGTVESVRFANPHVLVTIRTDASEVYTVEWQNIVQLRHGKVGPTTLNAGDRIVVIASPSRDPQAHMLSLVREIRRPADGWLWRRTTRQ